MKIKTIKRICMIVTAVMLTSFISAIPAFAMTDDGVIYEQDFETDTAEAYDFSNGLWTKVANAKQYKTVTADGNSYAVFHETVTGSDEYRRQGFALSETGITEGILDVRFRFRTKADGAGVRRGFVVLGDEPERSHLYDWLSLLYIETDGTLYTGSCYTNSAAAARESCRLYSPSGGTAVVMADKWYNYEAVVDLDSRSITVTVTDDENNEIGGISFSGMTANKSNYADWPYNGKISSFAAMFYIELDDIDIRRGVGVVGIESVSYRNSGGNATDKPSINTNAIEVTFTQAMAEVEPGAFTLNGSAADGVLSEGGLVYSIPVTGLVAGRGYKLSLNIEKLTPVSGTAGMVAGVLEKSFSPENVYINADEDFESAPEIYDFSGGAHSSVASNLFQIYNEDGNSFGKFHSASVNSNDDYRRVGMNISDGLSDGVIKTHFRFRRTSGKDGFVIIGDETANSGEYNWLGLLYINKSGGLYAGCGYGGNLIKSECALKNADGAAAVINDNEWYSYDAEIDLETRSIKVKVCDDLGNEVGNIWLRNLRAHGNDNKDERYVNWPYETSFKKLASMFTVDMDDIRINTVDSLTFTVHDPDLQTAATASVTVRGGEAGNKTLIIAQYATDDRLLSVALSSENLNDNETVRLSGSVPVDDAAVKAKAMLWDMTACKCLSVYELVEKENGRWPVEVDERGLDDPLSVSVTSDHAGNIFDGDDSKTLYINAQNNTSYDLSASLTYNWYKHNGVLIKKGGSIGFDIGARADAAYQVPVPEDIAEYDTYYLEITREVNGSVAGNAYEMTYEPEKYDFSIMNKLDPDESPNRAIRTNSHHGISWGDPATVLSMARDAGFSGIRDEIRWHQAETVKGSYTAPSGKRDWITNAENNGLSRLWILDYSNMLYTDNVYAFPDNSRFPGSEEAFLNYVDWVSRTYKGRIDYYQLWNEPDTKGFNYYRTGAKKYAELLKKVYEVIKANDPDAKVVGVAASRNGYSFANLVLYYGGGDYMDAISFHPYQASGKFSGESLITTINNYKNSLKAYGHEDMPILITEMGIAAYPEGGTWPNEYVAAAQTIQMWTIAQAEPAVEAVYEFHFQNNYPGILWDNAESEQQRWGLINHENELVPYSARPGAIAAAAYNKLIGNAELVDRYSTDADSSGHKTYIYRFRREKDGKDVLIYWTEYGNQTINIDLGAEAAEGYDMNSNATGTKKSKSGVFTLATSYKPSYIVGEFSKFAVSK